jgi:hypothetical protein
MDRRQVEVGIRRSCTKLVGWNLVSQLDPKNYACYDRRVSGTKLFTLVIVFFFTSVISVVTGSTSSHHASRDDRLGH